MNTYINNVFNKRIRVLNKLINKVFNKRIRVLNNVLNTIMCEIIMEMRVPPPGEGGGGASDWGPRPQEPTGALVSY